MASAGFEPANLGTKGQHATPRPPKSAGYPILNHEVLLHDGRVHVWLAVSAVGIVRSIFSCETINSHLYVTNIVTIPICEHLSDCKRQCNSSGCKHLPVQKTH